MIQLAIVIIDFLMSAIVWPIVDWLIDLIIDFVTDIIRLPFYLINTFMNEEHPWLKMLDDFAEKGSSHFLSWIVIAFIVLICVYDIPICDYIKKS